MIHHSCDRCQRLIETDDEIRYVVRLEVQANMGDNAFAEGDEERMSIGLRQWVREHHDRFDLAYGATSKSSRFKRALRSG